MGQLEGRASRQTWDPNDTLRPARTLQQMLLKGVKVMTQRKMGGLIPESWSLALSREGKNYEEQHVAQRWAGVSPGWEDALFSWSTPRSLLQASGPSHQLRMSDDH